MTPSPFTIITDSREQNPLLFPDEVRVIRRALKTGDYSVSGLEDKISIERKSKADAYKSLGVDRRRFKEEVIRLSEYERSIILIECDTRDFMTPPPGSLMNPIAAMGTLIAWSAKYGIMLMFCHDREFAASFVHGFLKKYWEYSNTENEDDGKAAA